MKSVWTIICILALIAAPMLLAQTNPACSRQPACASCHNGGTMSCCAAQPGSNPQSVPASSTRIGPQSDFSILIATLLFSTSARADIPPGFYPASTPLTASGVPLYTRNCARLI